MNIEELLNEIQPNYDEVVDVARHCDELKLKSAQDKARRYDMTSLVCDLDIDLDSIDPETDPLFVGGNVNGVPFGGINLIFSLFSYARYIEDSIYTDTGSGFVRKDHSNSFPVQMNELKDISSEHRKFAKEEIKRLNAYLCEENNSSCVCGTGICSNSERPTLMARKFKNVSRR